VVTDAAFQAQGCTASIGCGSALAEWLIGKSVAELKRMAGAAVAAAIVDEVGGLPEASGHAAALCAEGVRQLVRELG
jgi:nitrogen fixation NifU-like protein